MLVLPSFSIISTFKNYFTFTNFSHSDFNLEDKHVEKHQPEGPWPVGLDPWQISWVCVLPLLPDPEASPPSEHSALGRKNTFWKKFLQLFLQEFIPLLKPQEVKHTLGMKLGVRCKLKGFNTAETNQPVPTSHASQPVTLKVLIIIPFGAIVLQECPQSYP